MFKRQKKFAVLFVCFFVSVLTCLSGLSLILFKNNTYKSEYHTALSAASYARSRSVMFEGEEQAAALAFSYNEMITALRYNPHNEVNWRRLLSIIRLMQDDPDAQSSEAAAHVALILEELQSLQTDYSPLEGSPPHEAAGL